MPFDDGDCFPWNCQPSPPLRNNSRATRKSGGPAPAEAHLPKAKTVTRAIIGSFKVGNDGITINKKVYKNLSLADGVKHTLAMFQNKNAKSRIPNYGMIVLRGKTEEDTKVIGYFPFSANLPQERALTFYTQLACNISQYAENK